MDESQHCVKEHRKKCHGGDLYGKPKTGKTAFLGMRVISTRVIREVR